MVSDEEVIQIVQSYPAERRYALAAMQDMQHAFNYIPEKGLHCLAKHLNCGVVQLYSMATFYKALSLKPKGKHIIKICNGTACHIRGSVNLATGLKRELGIDPGETTEDGMFSVEMVNCLGSCALAPVMLVDGTYHNKLKLEDIPGIVERYRLADAEEGGGRQRLGPREYWYAVAPGALPTVPTRWREPWRSRLRHRERMPR